MTPPRRGIGFLFHRAPFGTLSGLGLIGIVGLACVVSAVLVRGASGASSAEGAAPSFAASRFVGGMAVLGVIILVVVLPRLLVELGLIPRLVLRVGPHGTRLGNVWSVATGHWLTMRGAEPVSIRTETTEEATRSSGTRGRPIILASARDEIRIQHFEVDPESLISAAERWLTGQGIAVVRG